MNMIHLLPGRLGQGVNNCQEIIKYIQEAGHRKISLERSFRLEANTEHGERHFGDRPLLNAG